jgi:hypothetical protein
MIILVSQIDRLVVEILTDRLAINRGVELQNRSFIGIKTIVPCIALRHRYPLSALVAFHRDMGNQGAARSYAEKLRAVSP